VANLVPSVIHEYSCVECEYSPTAYEPGNRRDEFRKPIVPPFIPHYRLAMTSPQDAIVPEVGS
jgi:hypothetical protein